MLLVSRWTIYHRVSEFGLTHLSRFSDITDEQLGSKVSAFLNEHGCLVGTSMILGHLRSEGLNIQREQVRKCLACVDPLCQDTLGNNSFTTSILGSWAKQPLAPRRPS